MRKLFLFLFIPSGYILYAQHNIVELPKFPSYFTKTTDTLNYYKNGGRLKGNVREVTKYLKSYSATSKYFNLKKEHTTDFGKRLYKIKSKKDNVKEIYFLDTNPSAGNSYRKRDKNNYYLGQIIRYDAKNRIRSFKKINDDLSEELIEYTYNSNNQLISIIEKVFLTVEVASEDGTEIQEVYTASDPTYIRTTKATYNNGKLEKLIRVEEDEYNENTIHAIKTFNYFSKFKIIEVLLETYQKHKETTKKIGTSEFKHFKLFYNLNNSRLDETILNYMNKQEGKVTIKTNYRQVASLPFEIIRITTSAELNGIMDVLTENFEIKRDKKQNIIEVVNKTNQDWSERITFKYKYY